MDKYVVTLSKEELMLAVLACKQSESSDALGTKLFKQMISESSQDAFVVQFRYWSEDAGGYIRSEDICRTDIDDASRWLLDSRYPINWTLNAKSDIYIAILDASTGCEISHAWAYDVIYGYKDPLDI